MLSCKGKVQCFAENYLIFSKDNVTCRENLKSLVLYFKELRQTCYCSFIIILNLITCEFISSDFQFKLVAKPIFYYMEEANIKLIYN